MKEKIFKKGFLNRLLAGLTAISIIFMGLPGTTAMASGEEWHYVGATFETGTGYRISLYATRDDAIDKMGYHANNCSLLSWAGTKTKITENGWKFAGELPVYARSVHDSRVLSCTCFPDLQVRAFFCDTHSSAKTDHGSGNDDLTECKHCGTALSAHTHTDHYGVTTTTSPNDTLTWYCGEEGCGSTATSTNPVKLTLSASSANYSGSAYTGASLDGKEAWESTIGTAPTIKYVGRDGTTYTESATAPTAVGKYTAKITFDTNKTATANFEITKASQTAPTTGEGYTIDYTAETITAGTDYEVSTSNTTLTPPAGGKVKPGTTYYVRKKGNDNNAPSAWTAISVLARPATPADLGSVMTTGAGNSDGKITGVSDAMEYSTDGTAWTKVSGTEITGLAAGTYKVRVKATATTFASESTDLTVVNPHAHSVGTKHDAVPGNCVDKGTLEYYDCTDTTCTKKLDKDGNELTSIEGTIDATKHKSTETTWTKTATNHKETYKCCGAIKTAEANHSGGTATCQAEAVCSVCQASYGEKADHNYKYSASANVLTVACQTTGCDKKVTLTLSASDANYSGSAVEPAITYGTTDEKAAWTSAGVKLPGSTDAGAPTVTKIYYNANSSGQKVGSALGSAPINAGKYVVEVNITYGTGDEAGQKASVALSYKIKKAAAPAAPSGLTVIDPQYIGGNNGKITGVYPTMEYSTDNGATWKNVTGNEITGLSTGTVIVRVKETENTNVGTAKEVTIQDGTEKNPAPAAPTGLTVVPASALGASDGKITGVDPSTMEYSLNNGTTWTDVPGTEITGLEAGKNVQVRLKETATHHASLSNTLMINYHTHSWSWKFDKTSHWQKCECGAKQNEADHSYVNGKCICGSKKAKPVAVHSDVKEEHSASEVVRAAEEMFLPLKIVEQDKTGVNREHFGIVPDKTYNLTAYVTIQGFVSAINKIEKANPKANTVSIYTGKPFTFNKRIVETIQKGGKTIVYYFYYKGHLYSVTVPATVDASKVLEKAGFAGPLYVGKVLGTTKLVK